MFRHFMFIFQLGSNSGKTAYVYRKRIVLDWPWSVVELRLPDVASSSNPRRPLLTDELFVSAINNVFRTPTEIVQDLDHLEREFLCTMQRRNINHRTVEEGNLYCSR